MPQIKLVSLVLSALLLALCEGGIDTSEALPNSIQSRLEAMQISIEMMRKEIAAVKTDVHGNINAVQTIVNAAKNEIQNNVNAAKGVVNAAKDVLRGEVRKGVHDIRQEISGKTIRFPNPVFGNSGANGYYIQGHVEILHNDVWGTICGDYFNQNNNGANVLCKMDGYRSGAYDHGKYKQPTGVKSSKIWLDDVRCSGSETDIDKCTHRAWGANNCNHSEDVGVRCYY